MSLRSQKLQLEASLNRAYVVIETLRSTGETFRCAVVDSGALNHVSQDKYIDQLRAFEGALALHNQQGAPQK